MKKLNRVAVFIDGSNFYHYLKDKEISFPKGIKFDYLGMVEDICDKRKCVSKVFYTGIFRNKDGTEKSKMLVRNQQRFLSKLENDGFTIERGKILYDSGRPREKGTDVKIAVDLVVGAMEDHYDTAILISSDTDLIPALKTARKKGKRVEYIGFSHAPSYGIQKNSDFFHLLLPKDIKNFTINVQGE